MTALVSSFDEVIEFVTGAQNVWNAMGETCEVEEPQGIPTEDTRPPMNYAANSGDMATAPMMKLINTLYAELGQGIQVSQAMTRQAASDLIDNLKAQKAAKKGQPRAQGSAPRPQNGGAPRQYNNDRPGSITQGQKNYVISILTQSGEPAPMDLDNWTYTQASTFISTRTSK
jgi:hypothetical protein